MSGVTEAPVLGRCTACWKSFYSDEGVKKKPLVSRATGLYFPVEFFCSEECYAQITNNPASMWAEPTAEQAAAFARAMKPSI